MKPLETHQKVLTTLCMMCSSDKSESERKKVVRIVFSLILFVIVVGCTVSSAIFIWNSAILEDQLYGLFQLCASVVATYPFIVAVQSRQKNTAIFGNINEIIDECKT